MTPVPQDQSPRTVPDLTQLAAKVRQARQLVQARRMAPGAPVDLVLARASLLEAMEDYAAELTTRGMPIPPRMRDDLRLLRQLRT